jgi:hypothetical protein
VGFAVFRRIPRSRGLRSLAQVLDEPARSSLDQIQHILEPVGAAIIRVRHFADPGLGRELQEEPQAVTGVRGRAALEGAQILPIHGENEIEMLEIPRLDHPGSQCREIIPAPGSRLARTLIWKLPDVVSGRAGGVDFQRDVRRLTGRDDAKHDLRGRRAADVPQTDEEDPHSGGYFTL